MRFVGGARQSWRRWWAPAGAEPPLSNGMLQDPTGPYGQWLAGGLVELEDRLETRCLILLGEPGSGKSDEVDREAARWRGAGVAVHPVDLGAQPDWAALRSEVFDAPEVATWAAGGDQLVLLLDGFDEAQATISKLTEGLVAGLRALALDRLFVRVTGRPGVWPQRLTDQLRSLWPRSFEALALAPLTAEDVRIAAQAALGDGEAFLQQVRLRDIGVLAARPITLGMLLVTASDGPLPDDRVELYARAVQALAAEGHERRVQDRASGPPAGRRVQAAETLATVTLLSGAPTVERRRGAVTRPGVMPLDDALDENVSMDELDAVWDSALLTPSAGDTLTWTHRSIAEFLCARGLTALPLKTTRHLLSDGEPSRRIVPQLAGVAVWAAWMSDPVFDWVIGSEPDLLLTPDLRTASPDRRRRLARALLAELVEDHPPGEFRHYNLLDYPELPSDLEPLLDPAQPTWVRREAIRFLADTNRREHDGLLMDLIEDVASRHSAHSYDDEVALADVAAYALGNASDPTLLDRAAAVAVDQDAPSALRAELISLLWPHRDLAFILGLLESDLLGHRRSTLARKVSDGLAAAIRSGAADPATVLDWLLGHPRTGRHTDLFAHVAAAAVTALVTTVDLDDEAWSSIGRLAADYAHESNDVFDWRTADTSALGMEARRRLALETLLASGHVGEAFSLRASGLLPDEDFEYWLNVYADAAGRDAAREAAARNALFLLARPTDANRELVARVAVERPELETWRREWSDPKVLQQWQDQQDREASRKAEEAARQAEAQFSPGRLETYLEAGQWPLVAAELARATVTDGRTEQHVVGYPLSLGPGWRLVGAATHERVLHLALEYLATLPAGITRDTASHVGDAYALVSAVAPERLGGLDAASLLPWLPALFELPGHHSTVGVLLEAVAAVRPAEVESLVVKGIEEDANSQYAAHASRLGRYTTPAVEDALARAADRDTTSAWVLDEMLPALVERDPARAVDLIFDIIGRRPGAKPESGVLEDVREPALRAWERATSAATALVSSDELGASFDRLLSEFVASQDFAAAVIGWSDARPTRSPWAALASDQLATLYLWATSALPAPTRPPPGTTVGVDPVREFAGEVFRKLRARTDAATVAAFERIANESDDPWARTAAAAVRAAMRAQTWSPLSPSEVKAIVSEPARRVVTTEAQLAEVLLDAIDDFQAEATGSPDVRQQYWHRQRTARGDPLRFIPLGETEFTTRLVDRLRPRLDRIVLRQEVQLHHRFGSDAGTFPDIEAIAQDPIGSEVVVLGEVKGNWHDDVATALEDELVDLYLQGGRSATGIYIVAWYHGELWDPDHYQRRDAARHTKDDLRMQLEATAARLSSPERALHVRVIDLALNSDDVDVPPELNAPDEDGGQ